MIRHIRLAAAVFAVGALLVVPRASAQSEADALISRAIELRGEGRDMEALELLVAAYEASPTPRSAAQLGFCNQALGRWVEAERRLLEAVRAEADPWIAQRRATLEESLAFVRRNLGSLEVLSNVEGATVRIGGDEVGVTPLDRRVRVQAGQVEIEVSHPGYERRVVAIVVVPGGEARQLVELVARTGTTAEAGAVANEHRGNARSARALVGPITLFSVAVAGALTFAVSGGLALSEDARLADDCGANVGARCTGDDLAALHRRSLIADIGWITAAAALVAGVTWLTFALRRTDSGPSALRLSPWATAGAGGLVLRGSLQ
ncbi:MAG: PEGA domain-containing protein [Myxococcales bacterium]|nr:PEGA domain-containing protein [Myxococcales bacterium]